MRRSLPAFVFMLLCFIPVFTGCSKDPYKDFAASGLEAKAIPFDMENEKNWSFGVGKVTKPIQSMTLTLIIRKTILI